MQNLNFLHSLKVAQKVSVSLFIISLNGTHKTHMQKLNFLHSLEVAQKFAVAEPEIIMQSQQLYGVKRDFSVSFRPRPKLNNFTLTSQQQKM